MHELVGVFVPGDDRNRFVLAVVVQVADILVFVTGGRGRELGLSLIHIYAYRSGARFRGSRCPELGCNGQEECAGVLFPNGSYGC